MTSRTKKYTDGKFSNRVNPKDGFAMLECKDARAKRVVQFLVLILYSKRPTWLTIIIENTIFGALSVEKKLDWAVVIKDVVQRLLYVVEKLKPPLICPYVFYLYEFADTMKLDKRKAYQIGEAIAKHNVDPDPKLKLTKANESKHESLISKEIKALAKTSKD